MAELSTVGTTPLEVTPTGDSTVDDQLSLAVRKSAGAQVQPSVMERDSNAAVAKAIDNKDQAAFGKTVRGWLEEESGLWALNANVTQPAMLALGGLGVGALPGIFARMGRAPVGQAPSDEFTHDADGYNPYKQWVALGDDSTKYEHFVNRGELEDVKTAQDFMAVKADWDRRIENDDAMANGGLLATGVGVLAAGFIDVSSAIPIIGQGSRVVKMAKAGAAFGAAEAANEGLLHYYQPDRTIDESLFNIGVATLVGGGIGAFAKLHKAPDGSPRPVDGLEADRKYPPAESPDGSVSNAEFPNVDSAGAQRATESTDLAPDGHRLAGKVDHQVGSDKWLDQVNFRANVSRLSGGFLNMFGITPTARSFQWTVRQASEAVQTVIDTGSLLTNATSRGTAKVSAERLAAVWQHELGYRPMLDMDSAVITLNKELGLAQGSKATRYITDSVRGIGAAAKGKAVATTKAGRITADDINDLVGKIRHKSFTDADMKQYAERLGDEGAAKVKATADKVAESFADASERLEKMLIDAELLDPAKAKGRDYSPIIPDSLWLSGNKAEAEGFFLKIFTSRPTNDFLEDMAMTSDMYDDLGKIPVKLVDDDGKLVELSIEEGKAFKTEILQAWGGDIHDMKLGELSAKVEALEAKQTREKASIARYLNELPKEYNSLKNKISRLSIKQVRLAVKESIALRESKAAFVQTIRAEEAQVVKAVEAAKLEGTKRQLFDAPKGAQQIEKRLATLERKLSGLQLRRQAAESNFYKWEAAVTKAQSALKKAEDLKAERKIAFDELTALRKQVADLKKSSGSKATKKIQRMNRRLEKAVASGSINDRVKKLVTKMSDGKSSGLDNFDVLDPESGRLKARTIPWEPENIREAMEMGLIRSDYSRTHAKAVHDLTATLALKKAFGGRSASEMVASIEAGYEEAIRAARLKGNEKAARYLNHEKGLAIKDFNAVTDRLRGTFGRPNDPDSIAHYLSREARKLNYARLGLGFGVSQLPDLVTNVMYAGFAATNPAEWHKSWKYLKTADGEELAALVDAIETAMSGARLRAFVGLSEESGVGGIGAAGSALRSTTGAVDQTLDALGTGANHMSGMHTITRVGKLVALSLQSRSLAKIAPDYENLLKASRAGDRKAQLKIHQLAALGLDADAMRGINRAIKKHGVTTDDAGNVLGLPFEKWRGDGDMQELFSTTMMSMEAHANRAIMTPGAGDTPLFMSTWYGAMFGQFLTFGFTATNRLIRPAAQRTAMGDMNAPAMAAASLFMGSLVVASKDIIREGEVNSKRSNRQWIYDSMDRSGFYGYLSSPVGTAWQMTLGEQTSKYKYVSGWGKAGGATAGLLDDAFGAASAALHGDGDRALDKATRLLPYNTVFQIQQAFQK